MAETNKGIYYPTFAEVGEETYDGPVKMKMMAESIDPLLLSDEDKTKLDNIEAGAEVNVIESVKVNGTALTITDKAVDVPVPTKTSDLTNDSGFGTYSKPNGGIPSTDLSSAVQTSLGKADTAVQDVSGKEDKSNKVTSISSSSTNTQYPSAKLLYDQLAEKQEQIDALVEENSTLKKQQLKGQASGSSIQLTDSAEGLEIENVVIKGAMGQETRSGKNVLNQVASITSNSILGYETGQTSQRGGITYVRNADKTISYSGTRTDDCACIVAGYNGESGDWSYNNGYVLPAGTYKVVWENSASNNIAIVAFKYTSNEGFIGTTTLKGASNTATSGVTTITADGETAFCIGLNVNADYPTQSGTVKIMVVANDVTDYTYEPYGAMPSIEFSSDINCVTGTNIVKVQNSDASLQQTAPLTLGNIKLYDGDKITIAYVEQAGYKKVTGASIVRKWKEYIVTGNETVSLQNSGTRIYMRESTNNFAKPLRATEQKLYGLYCSHLVEKTPFQTWVGLQGISYDLNPNTGFEGFNISINDFSTVQEYLNWFKNKYDAGTPFYIVYQLAEPETTAITDPTLLSQLETLINMKTYKQITNIDTTGSDLAPVLEFQYSKDLQTVIDNMQAQILS